MGVVRRRIGGHAHLLDVARQAQARAGDHELAKT
jgi:hypothetical protein